MKFDNDLMRWVMDIGQCRNVIQNSFELFEEIRLTLDALEHAIPQFHKQPSTMKQLKNQFDELQLYFKLVKDKLEYPPSKGEIYEED